MDAIKNKQSFSLRKLENLHIPLWLLKDTCWMMEWRLLGVIMILPTISVAIILAIRTFRKRDFFINAAICFWIFANAFWMCCEFFNHVEWKFFAGIPFGIGILFTTGFYTIGRRMS